MHFESKTTDSKKKFIVTFPQDALITLFWDEEERELLKEYDESTDIGDKLRMLAMIADKIERRKE